MTMRHYRIGLVTIGLATVLGCAGKSLNDVGDLDTGGAGEGGAGDGSGASAGTAGATGGGSGGTNGGGTGAGSGGTNGGGTSGGAAGGTDGAGRDIGPCNEGDGCLFEDGTGIRALAADATHLYWVEYGTTDELGNYANDGRLLSRAFDSTDVTTLATDLAGSVGVAVTTTHVYAFVDWFWQDGGERYAIVRVPLAGGELQTVHVDLTPRTYGKCAFSGKCFYAYDDAGYWYRTDGVYEITAASDAAVRIADEPLELIGVDESHLFYIVDPGSPRVPVELWKIPRSDGDAGLVTNDAKNARHSLSGEYIYALAGTLFRMPKAGGRWTALAQLFVNPGYELSIAGDVFYFDAHPGEWSLTRGSLSNPEAADVIIHLPSEPEGWVGTPAGAYWTDGSAIYFRAID
jgi:hypothetical protein